MLFAWELRISNLCWIDPSIVKQNTFLRESIPIQERLALTLSFSATGDSYASLQHLGEFITIVWIFFGSHRTVFALHTSVNSTVFSFVHSVFTNTTQIITHRPRRLNRTVDNVAVTLHRHSLVWTRLKGCDTYLAFVNFTTVHQLLRLYNADSRVIN
jgi:hypothetical protein